MTDSDDLRASRSRLGAAALADRRRFERALHDGVQQDLIALAVGLQLVRGQIEGRPEAQQAVDELLTAAHEALDRVRTLANQIYPSVLDAQGLAGTSRRYPAELEAAVALTSPTIIREEPGRLVVELADAAGARDLLEAAGATVALGPDGIRAEFRV
jgi:signal transduction histidine kinase